MPKQPTVVDQPPWPAASSSSATYVPGFGIKGAGKAGNYGREIESPSTVDPADLPASASEPSSKKAKQEIKRSPELVGPPVPIYATTEQVEEWMMESFRPLTGLSNKMPPDVGDSVLWRGVKMGKRGNPSTVVEHFNAKVRSIDVEQDNEIYCYVD